MLNKIFKNFKGIAITEYALLATLVVVVCIASMTDLGQSVSNKFHNAAVDLEDEEDGTGEGGGGGEEGGSGSGSGSGSWDEGGDDESDYSS